MLTSLGKRGDAVRFEQIGFSAYLTKPVKQAQLYHCLAMVSGEPQPAPAAEARKTPIITRHSIAEAQKKRLRILLAEDDMTNQKVAINILKKYGYQVDAVADGREAIKALEIIPYSIVLMDVQMPEMNGFEATAAIRSSQSRVFDKDVPIIALTAHAMKQDQDECIQAGMNDFTTKPIIPEELIEKIQKWTQMEPEPAPVQEALPGAPDMPGSDLPILNLEKALNRAMDDRDFLAILMQEFYGSLKVQLESMRSACQHQDTVEVQKMAHKLRGASASLNAERITAAARQIELTCQRQMESDGTAAAVAPLIQILEKEIHAFKNHAQTIDWLSLN